MAEEVLEGRAAEQPPEEDTNALRQVRVEKLTALQAAGQDPFAVTTAVQSIGAGEIAPQFAALEGSEVSLCGRMMSRRDMGKANFIDLRDRSGRMQIYVRIDDVGEDCYTEYKKWDIGDILEVRGTVFRTRRGEVSVHATALRLLTKSLLPLPEKFHGLTDTDARYRRRYLDLIMNPESQETFRRRTLILREIRRYMDDQGFWEVDTPILVHNAGGAAARPFLTHHNALDEDLKLRISLELYLKRLLVGGMERVYEMGKCFRNEGVDARHSPEFTLLEFYQAYTDYNGMMDLTENLIRTVAQNVLGTAHISYEGVEIDLESPFARITMTEAVRSATGIDFASIDEARARELAKARGLAPSARHRKGDILNLFFEEYVEETLVQPTFVLDHPVEISPLTKRKPGQPEHVERFELFITGREFANAYSELNDPIDQRGRFADQEALFAAGDEEAQHTDEDFLTALEYGMPPAGGEGIGIDRLVMLLTDSHTIRDVQLFPTMKSHA
ncbi:MAG: lysine--tRNA ligase [Oscillospiraceae bacterium]|jgi:lysyl-tRNA synthetase class 2|nr:lysine--tRNA ligase [Oscillospiraceae bacterium]